MKKTNQTKNPPKQTKQQTPVQWINEKKNPIRVMSGMFIKWKEEDDKIESVVLFLFVFHGFHGKQIGENRGRQEKASCDSKSIFSWRQVAKVI